MKVFNCYPVVKGSEKINNLYVTRIRNRYVDSKLNFTSYKVSLIEINSINMRYPQLLETNSYKKAVKYAQNYK